MARSSKFLSTAKPDDQTPAQPSRVSQVRKANHLKDEVYREMLRLEVNRPGGEMGLALALLRAIVQSESLAEQAEYREWLKTICPVGLRMIEAAPGEGWKCELKEL
jgi:hypothetical protein